MAALPDTTPVRVSRRSVLGLGLVGAGSFVVVGCSSGSSADGDEPDREAAVEPDVRTATAALAAIRGTHQAARATTQRFPATRVGLSGLIGMHAAHERSLVDAVPTRARESAAPAPYAVPRLRPKALARLGANEAKLHDTLQSLALKAESGEFARLLASMAAGISVQLPSLATEPS